MFRAIHQFFETQLVRAVTDSSPDDVEHDYQLAVAALLIEMSRADFDVKAVERSAVTDAVERVFNLSSEETKELIRLAEVEADHATSLYEFTRLINDHFTAEQKYHVIELLWRVAFADGKVDRYEDYLVRKVADLIYVPHSAFIQAKHQVQQEMEAGSAP